VALYCEFCHRRIRDQKKMVVDAGYAFCSEDCHCRAIVLFEEDVRESIRRSEIEKKLMGTEKEPPRGFASLPPGDAGRATMLIAALYERKGDYNKAIVCWKKIALLHKDNLAIRRRALKRINDLKRKGSVKCQPEVGR